MNEIILWVARDRYGGLAYFISKPIRGKDIFRIDVWIPKSHAELKNLLEDSFVGNKLTWEMEPRAIKLVPADVIILGSAEHTRLLERIRELEEGIKEISHKITLITTEVEIFNFAQTALRDLYEINRILKKALERKVLNGQMQT